MQTSRREPFELRTFGACLAGALGRGGHARSGLAPGSSPSSSAAASRCTSTASLFRIDGVDADAIGKEPIAPKVYPEHPTDEQVKAIVWDELREVYDPEIPCSIVELGLVYVCELKPLPTGGLHVFIQMTVTAPGCGMGEQLMREVGERLEHIPRVDDFKVELVYEPFWQQSMMSDSARLQLGMM